MSHIFISYSHKDPDREYAYKLEAALQQEGFEVWIDDRIDYGTQWPRVVQQAVDELGIQADINKVALVKKYLPAISIADKAKTSIAN